MLESQEEEISNLLIEYAAGNYAAKGSLSNNLDSVDMIIQGINMLGEELQATNVSKDYFLSIYNAVTDIIIILDNDSIITDVNCAASSIFNISSDDIIGKSIYHFIGDKKSAILEFSKIPDSIAKSYTYEGEINYNNKKIIGLITSSRIIDRFEEQKGYLIKIKDITETRKTEKRIVQAIIKTEQHEQKRMADQLHDSLAQEVAMAKLMVTNLEAYANNDPNFYRLIETSKDILDEAITHIREICYNLMPSVLIKGNIDVAISEFVKKLNSQNIIGFKYESQGNFDDINPEIEIMVFRIVQEFVNNSIKHSDAKNVIIKAEINSENEFCIELTDNGIGFNPKKLKPYTDGRGINNLKSKVNAFEGKYTLTSEIDKGTSLVIVFPKTKNNE